MRKSSFTTPKMLLTAAVSAFLLSATLMLTSCCVLHMPAMMFKKHDKDNGACAMHSGKAGLSEKAGTEVESKE